MSFTIRNAAPRPILLGIKDESGRPPIYEPDLIPTHLPHFFIFAERGPILPQYTIGDDMVRKFGSETFEERSDYFTHQTALLKLVNAEGNQMMVQRLVPPNANPPATLRISVDFMQDMIPEYERDIDGRYVLDENGEKIPTGNTVLGHVLRWIVGPTMPESFDGRLLEDGENRVLEDGYERILESSIGGGSTSTGTMINYNNEQSTIYPIIDIEVADFGSYGNRLGIRLSAPTTRSEVPIDDGIVEDNKAYLYRIQFVERSSFSSATKILENLFGEQFIDFSFKEGAFNRRTNQELYYEERVLPSFYQEPAGGRPEILSPFGKFHVYHSYLDEIMTSVQELEHPFGLVSDDPEEMHMVNVFMGHDYNAIPYHTVKILGPEDEGILFTPSSTYYCMDGFDGIMDFETFDLGVRHQLENYGDLEAKVLDSAVYPQSCCYDTGFTLDTKKAFFVPMGRRKDMFVVVATQDVSFRQNRPSEETSLAIALRTAARMYPESEVYGTHVCRALIVGHSGYLLNNPYKGLLPLTVELGQKFARYMGAGIGIWKEGQAFDRPFNNHVKLFKGVNAPWVSTNVQSNNWEAGLVWVQNYDRRSLFFPGIQTVYDDDTSVLNAAANMMIAVELEKVAERTWRDLTGISYLTPEQFIERSNRLIEERTRGRFDNRVTIVPNTYYTYNDEQRGYSWTCDIIMYAPNMKTVGTFTIIARRISDLAAA